MRLLSILVTTACYSYCPDKRTVRTPFIQGGPSSQGNWEADSQHLRYFGQVVTPMADQYQGVSNWVLGQVLRAAEEVLPTTESLF